MPSELPGRKAPCMSSSTPTSARLSATMWLPSGTIRAPAPLNVAPASMLMLLFSSRRLPLSVVVLPFLKVRKVLFRTLIVDSGPAATVVVPSRSVLDVASYVPPLRIEIRSRQEVEGESEDRVVGIVHEDARAGIDLTVPPNGNAGPVSRTSSVVPELARRRPLPAAPSQSLSLAAVWKTSVPPSSASRCVLLMTRARSPCPRPECRWRSSMVIGRRPGARRRRAPRRRRRWSSRRCRRSARRRRRPCRSCPRRQWRR